ncbi:MAG: DNA-processing protein DprA [Bacteroidales bacterium]|nr:DNA-processing protein DprA [Bacteroidales bacterium]
MNYSDEHIALCALNKIFGYHPALALALIEKAGSAMECFSVMPGTDRASHPELLSQLTPASLEWARKELRDMDSRGFRFMAFMDEDYPEALRECGAPPIGLYLNGSSSPTEIFGLRPMIGFVGTRDISPYGRLWCQKLVRALAEAPIQPCIVSGMALGADGIAHRTALECGLPTIGVMATGIDSIYPVQHERLAIDIVGRPGCALVTDYPMGTSPVALNFLRRNRIIAGLVSAVVVVESKTKGGSLMTARYACEYDREVFAVPGRIDDVRSAGCNSLIHAQMARIVTSPEELVGELGLGRIVRGPGGSWASGPGASLRSVLGRKYGELSAQVRIGDLVKENVGITVDALAARLHLPHQEVVTAVAIMEADGVLTTDLLGRCSLTPNYA